MAVLVHERVLEEQEPPPVLLRTALLCIVCGTQSALLNCLSASKWVYSTTGIASTETGFLTQVRDLHVGAATAFAPLGTNTVISLRMP